MEAKYNASTEARPEGDRVLNAPLVHINIAEFIRQIKKEATWDNSDRNAITVYKTDGLSMVLVALHKGLPHSVTALQESVFLLTLATSPAK